MQVPSRARAAGAYAPAASDRQVQALGRECPKCGSSPKEWCVRVVRQRPGSEERGEMLYPVRLKKLHDERFQDPESGEE